MVLQKLVSTRYWYARHLNNKRYVEQSDGACYTMPPEAMRLDSPPCTNHNNNNSISSNLNNNNNAVSGDELALLAKLEEANRLYESDAKSLNSLSGGASASGHSRKSSDTSQISLTSGASSTQEKVDDGEDLWAVWGQIIGDWETSWKKQNAQVRDYVRRGIPVHFRGIAWQLLCSATEATEKKLYAEYIKTKSPCEKVIRRDIARTYPEHDFFKEKDGLGQESLFNVIKAYSLHDREVGYCQGTGFIVGLLLMQQMPEEETFAVLVKIMEDYRMRDMFKPSMAELGLCMFQLENLVSEQLPELYRHFQSQCFHTSMYASSWFLTLFTTTLSLPLACRIMDVFLSEGMEIIFKVALAMLTLGRDDLMSMDMEGMLKFFQKELPSRAEADQESLMRSSFGMKINTKKMKKLEKEYSIIKAKEQEEMAELKRLRNDNKKLKERCEMLEEESKALADRLVRGQVSRAEEEETTFVVQRELDGLRHTHLATTHQLALAQEKIKQLSLIMEETHSSRQSSLEEMSLKAEQLEQRESMIVCLQEELVKVRLREAENDVVIRDLRARIHELEEDKKTLREITPDNSVAHLQEELIAVKLREAEANLSLKDLRQRVSELSSQWQRHLQDGRQDSSSSLSMASDALSTPKKLLWGGGRNETQKLEEELMTTRIREMETLTEVKELRLKVMELETQVQVGTNQLRRQDEEIKKQKELLETAELKDRDCASNQLIERRRYADLESRMKDELMKARISDTEKTQAIAELTQKISQLELKNEEIATEGELRSHQVDDSDRVRDLQDKVADLQAEVMRLEAMNFPKGSFRVPTGRTASIDSTDEESKIRIFDDPSLHLRIADSPSEEIQQQFPDVQKPQPENHNNNSSSPTSETTAHENHHNLEDQNKMAQM
ncbi:PREDICTED: ecotropic viral integration site 5 ortholog isoform X2 [Nicrophorus vespilloides]|uniref:Ecotropic viral integration site 5 ortholog isoform X2 n=1 Tax=Nicrophorus vespilloides TaxID=110193 RepID=A0ABM1MHD3_NICVS|nr:PREDICTED: ecotropic viral integration site 5 ortholog isoform X2 [Nicrophorus vespilloides]